MKAIRLFLLCVSAGLLTSSAALANSLTVSWTAAQLKAAINGGEGCRTDVCNYNVIAGDVDDAVLGSNFEVETVKGPSAWYASRFAGPPAGADWNNAGGQVYLSSAQSAQKLGDDESFSIKISSPQLAAGQRVRVRFTFTGVYIADPLKSFQVTVYVNAVAAAE